MVTKLEKIQEIYDRGLTGRLSSEKQTKMQELIRRGLIKTGKADSSLMSTDQPIDDSSFGSGGFISSMMPDKDSYKEAKQTASDYYRPALEMGGMTAGAIVGTAGGPGVGTVVGGGLGYSIGTTTADLLDEFLGLAESEGLLKETAKAGAKTVEGAAYTAGGEVLPAVIGGSARGLIKAGEKIGLGKLFRKIKDLFPKLSDKQILQKAKDILKDVREGDDLAKTADETDEVLNRLGVKEEPTFAQKTGGTKAASFEQSTSAKNNQLREILLQKDAKISAEGVAGVEKQFSQPGTISDVVSNVEKQADKLAKQHIIAKEISDRKLIKSRIGKNVKEQGESVIEALKSAKKIEKTASDELYAKIPEGIYIKSDPIVNGLEKTVKDYQKKGGGKDSYPRALVREIQKKLSKKVPRNSQISFDDLRDLRSQIGEEIRDNLVGSNPNLKLVRRLKMLEEAVDGNMDKMLKLGPENSGVVNAYRDATKNYKEFIKRFRKGSVGNTLEYGNQPSGLKTPYSDVPGRFFSADKIDRAQEIIRAVGKDKAGKLIDDYASMDFLRAEVNGTLKTNVAQKWLKNNESVLKEYGLYDKYDDMVKSLKVTDEAFAKLTEFQKTVASRIIGYDIDDIIPTLFKGKAAQSAKTMNELLNMPGVIKNPHAVNGIKKAFKDFYMKSTELSGVDVMKNPVRSINKAKQFIDKYMPAMKVLYKDNPKQLQAMVDYHKLLRILDRNKNVTYAKNSTTAEKLSGLGEGIGSNIAQFLAVAKGSGWYFSSLRNLAKSILSAPTKYTNQQVERLLTEAIYDPAVAETIMYSTKPKIKVANLRRRIAAHMTSIGIAQNRKE